MTASINTQYDTVLILDFGSQYSHLITRRVREAGVYSELLPCTQPFPLPFKPKGVILSGSPYSVYDPEAPHVNPAVFDLGVPILGICYGLQELAQHFGGQVEAHPHREYGQAKLQRIRSKAGEDSRGLELLKGVEDESLVLMSHGDQLNQLPPNFHVLAKTETAPFAAVAHDNLPIFGELFIRENY